MLIIRKCERLLLGLTMLLTTVQVALALDFGQIAPDEIAVYVQDLTTGQVIAEHRADAEVNPASTMKLVTAFAALRTLGPNYRWQTTWYTDGPVKNGVLQGNLYWPGSGDPVFDQDDIQALQTQLRLQGIKEIAGNLVLDRTIWGNEAGADGFDSDKGRAFVTAPDAHMVAYNVLWIKALRDKQGRFVAEMNPPLAGSAVKVNVKFRRKGSCRSLSQHLHFRFDGKVVHLSGALPVSCVGQQSYYNMGNSANFAALSFNAQWQQGGSRALKVVAGSLPKNARIVAQNASRVLSDVLVAMNKNSNNLIARTVFLTIGHHEAADRLTTQNAERAVRRELIMAGLDDETLVLENGAGLSRKARLTARFLGEALAKIYHSQERDVFISTLPEGGVDGTLKHRFKDLSGLHMKTGTLKDVRALAGFWLPEQEGGHPLAIVVVVNSKHSSSYLPQMDSLVRRVVSDARAFEANFSHTETIRAPLPRLTSNLSPRSNHNTDSL